MATQRRLVYFLVFLVIVLPVITGILVWQLLPDCSCDEDSEHTGSGNSNQNQNQGQTTPPGITPRTTPGGPSEEGPWTNLRLPRSVVPLHYDITLFPNFYEESDWFYGNETIEIELLEETKYIMIHTNYLNITATALTDESGNSIDISRTFEYKPRQFWVVEARQPIAGRHKVFLDLQFDGWLSRAIVGLYKSTYVNSQTNESSSIATSKFEPVAARRAFPCFDEPNIKAQFSVKIIHRRNYTALSNMPVQNTTNHNGFGGDMVMTSFERSVNMSTYLVCFIVCDFGYLERYSSHGIKVRLYAPHDRLQQTNYSLGVAVTTVDLYTDMFNLSYPLPKLDLIAIPDFVSGAMEHWGLITFREVNLLYDENQSSSSNKQRVAIVVAHEVSHQWFGNLVTMDWWQDLWLNEGFASYMEYIGAAEHEPTWKMMDQFLIDDLQPVMVTDAGLSSHPIVVDVEDPDQINAVFDSISYSKGASVIRMLQQWMGQERFFRGVSAYLKRFQYGNAVTDDLWEMLGNITSSLSVKDVMDTWTKQMGLPCVTVAIDTTGQKVTVTQERFLADKSFPSNESTSPFGYKWYINLDYDLSSGSHGDHLLAMEKTNSFNVQENLNNAGSWIKFNVNQSGFYRVNYPEAMWTTFSEALKSPNHGAISAADRSNLIDDAFNLARAGLLPYPSALSLTDYLEAEGDLLPWTSISSALGYIARMLEFSPHLGLYHEYMLKKVAPVYAATGWNDPGTHLGRLQQYRIISLACGYGHAECLDKATEMFQSWLYNGTSVSPNYRSLVYKYGMRMSLSSRDWEVMWERFKREQVAQEKSKLMSALAQSRTVWILLRYIEYAQDENNVRSQDFFNVLRYIAANPVGRGLVWDWVKQNWQYLVDRFTLYSRYFGRLVPAVISNFNTQYQLEDVEAFFAKYPDAGAGANGRKQALENIRRNIKWMAANKDVVVSWFGENLSTAA